MLKICNYLTLSIIQILLSRIYCVMCICLLFHATYCHESHCQMNSLSLSVSFINCGYIHHRRFANLCMNVYCLTFNKRHYFLIEYNIPNTKSSQILLFQYYLWSCNLISISWLFNINFNLILKG